MWYDRRTASPLEPLSRRTMASKRRLFEMRLACLGGGLVLALSLSSGCSHTEDSVGFVLEKHGEWYLEKAPSQTLFEGKEIPAGAKIRPKEEGQEGEKCLLTICLYTGQAKVYTGPATLPARLDPSSVNPLSRVIGGRYSGGFIHALSRGKEISDGVQTRKGPKRTDRAPKRTGRAPMLGDFDGSISWAAISPKPRNPAGSRQSRRRGSVSFRSTATALCAATARPIPPIRPTRHPPAREDWWTRSPRRSSTHTARPVGRLYGVSRA